MNRLLKLLVLLPAILFLAMGIRWFVAPAGMAGQLGLTLEHGVGLSSQVGDLGAFFLTLALCMLTALVTGRRIWYYPAIMLLSLAATGRTLAWLLHDAALAMDLIAPEVVVAIILVIASRRLPERD